MAKKIKGPQMILANYLDDGRVVFFTGKGWSVTATDGAYAEGDAANALLDEANKSVADNTVAGCELIPALITDGTPYPSHMKHVMQAKGPSVRADLGYQVSTDWEAR
ncbi:MAG: DUF2849 domain-containing protein [Kordiimonadaceae bacterium]|nr:DUF2849 domain-containing protein [Kordiimonadaceae bacterium]